MINCACGKKGCPTKIQFGDGLWFTDRNGNATLMYLDANSLVALVHEARTAYLDLLNE